jgi:hypothetical protein
MNKLQEVWGMSQLDEENEQRQKGEYYKDTEVRGKYYTTDNTGQAEKKSSEPRVVTRINKLFSETGKWLSPILFKVLVFIIFFFILLFFIKIAAPNFFVRWFMPTTYQITSSSVMEMLKSEAVKKLILNETTIRVAGELKDLAVKSDDYSVIGGFRDLVLGEKQLFFMINVKYSFGIDLEKITSDDVRIDEETITIVLPEPEVLENKPDYKTLGQISKTPVLRALWDNMSGRDVTLELVTAIQDDAGTFAKQNGMNISKEECIKYLDAFFNAIISSKTNKRIIFK